MQALADCVTVVTNFLYYTRILRPLPVLGLFVYLDLDLRLYNYSY